MIYVREIFPLTLWYLLRSGERRAFYELEWDVWWVLMELWGEFWEWMELDLWIFVVVCAIL